MEKKKNTTYEYNISKSNIMVHNFTIKCNIREKHYVDDSVFIITGLIDSFQIL